MPKDSAILEDEMEIRQSVPTAPESGPDIPQNTILQSIQPKHECKATCRLRQSAKACSPIRTNSETDSNVTQVSPSQLEKADSQFLEQLMEYEADVRRYIAQTIDRRNSEVSN
jgi:hypothetical protein